MENQEITDQQLELFWREFQLLQAQYRQIYSKVGESQIAQQLRDLLIKTRFAIEDFSLAEARQYMDRLRQFLEPLETQVVKAIEINSNPPDAAVAAVKAQGYADLEQSRTRVASLQKRAQDAVDQEKRGKDEQKPPLNASTALRQEDLEPEQKAAIPASFKSDPQKPKADAAGPQEMQKDSAALQAEAPQSAKGPARQPEELKNADLQLVALENKRLRTLVSAQSKRIEELEARVDEYETALLQHTLQ